MKKQFAVLVLMGILLISGVAIQAAATPNEHANEKAKNRVASIPENAVELEPGLFFTGYSQDEKGKTVGGLLYVYYQKEYAKPSWAGGNKDNSGSSSCYEFIAKGLKWKSPSTFIIDPSNSNGDLTDNEIENIILNSMSEWNDHAPNDPFGQQLNDIVTGSTWDNDGKNEIFFADIDQPGVIAAVQVYGVWWGPPSERYMIGQDLIFDNVDFQWTNVDSTNLVGKNVMDLENIAQHELGHSAALSHPDDSCTEETMYRYAGAWEVKKRDLNNGDIAGIVDLYS